MILTLVPLSSTERRELYALPNRRGRLIPAERPIIYPSPPSTCKIIKPRTRNTLAHIYMYIILYILHRYIYPKDINAANIISLRVSDEWIPVLSNMWNTSNSTTFSIYTILTQNLDFTICEKVCEPSYNIFINVELPKTMYCFLIEKALFLWTFFFEIFVKTLKIMWNV